MVFPTNNLPTQSRFWGREVEKKIVNLENSLRSSDINNTTRDSQLQVTATQAVVAANLAQGAAQEAADAAAAASAAAITANTAATTANNAITGLGSLDEATSSYKINAANVTVGTLNAININGSVITGSTLSTASSGRRVEIQSTSTAYYDEAGNFTGRILGAGTDRGATLELTSGASGAVYIWNGGVISYGAGGTYAGLSDNGFAVGGNRLYTIGANIEADGALITTGALTRTVLAGGGTTGASITDGGNFVRTSSSQRYKTDIQLLDINLNDLYAVEPKTFKRIEEVEEHGEAANVYPGFIAEELAGTSLDKFVFYSKDEEGNSRPEGIHYPELTAALLVAIKDLNSRIQALESR